MGVKNMLVLRWNQRAHYWFWGRPKGHIRGTKGHSALWKRPSENPGGGGGGGGGGGERVQGGKGVYM